MSKSISKTLLFIFSLLAISCSDEELRETQNIDSEANYQLKKAIVYDCPLGNQNRITVDNFFYGRFDSDGSDCTIVGNQNGLRCFPNTLRKVIQTEFLKGPKGNSIQTNYSHHISNVLLSDIENIPDLDLYTSISPQYSNKLYRYITCEIQDYLSTLPSLPLNQYYFPRASYVDTDFTFSGPEWNNSFITFEYDVEIKSY